MTNEDFPESNAKPLPEHLWPKRNRIVLDVSYDVKTEFKAATAIQGLQMTDVLHLFIKAYLGRHNSKLQHILQKYRNKGVLE